jgi:CspA family cold shock protein
MTVDAIVREWDADEGWGVLDSSETPGGCWAHFSAAAMPGYVSFAPGQAVRLDWESPGQDGYPYRAVRFAPSDRAFTDRPTPRPDKAYRSELALDFDLLPDD